MKESAIILRTRPYRDYDVIVDLLAEQTGRAAVIARGARRSRRRFGAALTLGAVVEVELHRRSASGLHTLTSCDIRSLPKAASGDLARFYQLAYVLEVLGLCVEGVHGIPSPTCAPTSNCSSEQCPVTSSCACGNCA